MKMHQRRSTDQESKKGIWGLADSGRIFKHQKVNEQKGLGEEGLFRYSGGWRKKTRQYNV